LVPLLAGRLRSLTLLAPLGLGPQIHGEFIQGLLRASREASLLPWLRLLFGDPAKATRSFSATAWNELASPDARVALADMAQRLLPDSTQADLLRDRLTDREIPVKLIWGASDRIVPPQQAAGLPGTVALHLLPGIGHLPQVEAVGLVAMLLRQQLGAGNAVIPGSAP
jgi:pyruvate dehydrogenase E2 component (dihydrolipoamide acetyltransferase)